MYRTYPAHAASNRQQFNEPVSSLLKDVPGYLGVFRAYLGRRMYVILVLTLFAAFAESFGIVMVLPLLQELDDLQADQSSGVQRAIHNALEWFGFANSTGLILFLITVAFLMKGVILFSARGYQAKLKANLLRDLKGRMFDEYSHMSYRHYSSNSTGHFINVINGQINKTIISFESLMGLTSQVITTMVYIALAFIVAWRFGLMAIIAGALLLFVFRTLNVKVRELSRLASRENSTLAKLLVQALQAFKYLSSTAQTENARAHVAESLELLADYQFKRGLANAFAAACKEPIAVVFVAVIMATQLLFFEAPLSPILVSILLLQRGLNTTMSVQGSWLATLGQIGSVEMVRDEFEAQSTHRQISGKVDAAAFSSDIIFSDVCFSYAGPEDDVLRDINLTIDANTSVAFVGPSGAGKSTLIDLLTLMHRPRLGTILIDDLESKKIDLASWRRQIGYVSQETVVFDDTIANNLCMWQGDYASDETLRDRVRHAAKEAYIHEFIETLPDGYQTQVGDRGIRLSGGQKQRLFIARELFRKPRLLILDEATSALDSESERFIQQSIDALKGHTTVVIIAHRLSTIRNVDTVYVLENGQIVEYGPYDQLRMREGSRFGQLVEMQAL